MELIKRVLDKGYVLNHITRESTTSFGKESSFEIYPVTINGDELIFDNLASPSIRLSAIPAEELEYEIFRWLYKQKTIELPGALKEKYIEQLKNPNKTYNIKFSSILGINLTRDEHMIALRKYFKQYK